MATATSTRYETIIGIEVHAQLRTESKMFCGCPTFSPAGEPDEPNTRVCPVCLGMQQRAAIIGGSLTIDSRERDGTRVLVQMPLAAEGG